MNIVIVGAGNVGCALGSDWLKTGHIAFLRLLLSHGLTGLTSA